MAPWLPNVYVHQSQMCTVVQAKATVYLLNIRQTSSSFRTISSNKMGRFVALVTGRESNYEVFLSTC